MLIESRHVIVDRLSVIEWRYLRIKMLIHCGQHHLPNTYVVPLSVAVLCVRHWAAVLSVTWNKTKITALELPCIYRLASIPNSFAQKSHTYCQRFTQRNDQSLHSQYVIHFVGWLLCRWLLHRLSRLLLLLLWWVTTSRCSRILGYRWLLGARCRLLLGLLRRWLLHHCWINVSHCRWHSMLLIHLWLSSNLLILWRRTRCRINNRMFCSGVLHDWHLMTAICHFAVRTQIWG